MAFFVWNPWHGCHKISEGCQNCYMFRRDASFEKDSEKVGKTASFSEPLRKKRDGGFAIPPGSRVFACMTSDFFLEEADEWRKDAWALIRARKDLFFTIITKRPQRFSVSLPEDWGAGWENVTLCATCENQKRADERAPILLSLPLCHREIICEPMLEKVDLEKYLAGGEIEKVTCGGESGANARLCRYEWILDLREQCARTGTAFFFKQTGARFEKDGRVFLVPRKDQIPQAQKSGLNRKDKN